MTIKLGMRIPDDMRALSLHEVAAFAHRPMPRPSCPAMYTTRPPAGSEAILSTAAANCGPHSQRSEPNTSPVRHSLCTRTRTFFFPATSPRTTVMLGWAQMLRRYIDDSSVPSVHQ